MHRTRPRRGVRSPLWNALAHTGLRRFGNQNSADRLDRCFLIMTSDTAQQQATSIEAVTAVRMPTSEMALLIASRSVPNASIPAKIHPTHRSAR